MVWPSKRHKCGGFNRYGEEGSCGTKMVNISTI